MQVRLIPPAQTKRQRPQKKQQQYGYEIGDGDGEVEDSFGIHRRKDSRSSGGRRVGPLPRTEHAGIYAKGDLSHRWRTESLRESRDLVKCGSVGSRPEDDTWGERTQAQLGENVFPKRGRSSSYDMCGSTNGQITTVSSESIVEDQYMSHSQYDNDISISPSANNGIGLGMGAAVSQFVGLAVGTRGALERSVRSARFVVRLETQPEESSVIISSDAQRSPKTPSMAPLNALNEVREPIAIKVISTHTTAADDGTTTNNSKCEGLNEHI